MIINILLSIIPSLCIASLYYKAVMIWKESMNDKVTQMKKYVKYICEKYNVTDTSLSLNDIKEIIKNGSKKLNTF